MPCLVLGAACAGGQPAASRTTPEDAKAPSISVRGGSPRDVPGVRIDLPATARAWDGDPAAPATAAAEGGGFAVAAFEEPGSARALAAGRRASATAGTVRAGIELLVRHSAGGITTADAHPAEVNIEPL